MVTCTTEHEDIVFCIFVYNHWLNIYVLSTYSVAHSSLDSGHMHE